MYSSAGVLLTILGVPVALTARLAAVVQLVERAAAVEEAFHALHGMGHCCGRRHPQLWDLGLVAGGHAVACTGHDGFAEAVRCGRGGVWRKHLLNQAATGLQSLQHLELRPLFDVAAAGSVSTDDALARGRPGGL